MSKIKTFLNLFWATHFMDGLKAQGKTSWVSRDEILGLYAVEWVE